MSHRRGRTDDCPVITTLRLFLLGPCDSLCPKVGGGCQHGRAARLLSGCWLPARAQLCPHVARVISPEGGLEFLLVFSELTVRKVCRASVPVCLQPRVSRQPWSRASCGFTHHLPCCLGLPRRPRADWKVRSVAAGSKRMVLRCCEWCDECPGVLAGNGSPDVCGPAPFPPGS